MLCDEVPFLHLQCSRREGIGLFEMRFSEAQSHSNFCLASLCLVLLVVS